jgi:hypothetical protein
VQEIEVAAGRLGYQEEALLEKERDKFQLPDDFPAPSLKHGGSRGKKGACSGGGLMADLEWSETVFGASALDDDELDAILNGDEEGVAADFALSGMTAADFPITDDGFDL